MNNQCINCVAHNFDFYDTFTHSCSCGVGGEYVDEKCGISCDHGKIADYNESTRTWSCTSCTGEGAFISNNSCACLKGFSLNGTGKCSRDCNSSEIIDLYSDSTWNCVACSGIAAVLVNNTCACESVFGNDYVLNGTECVLPPISTKYIDCPINYQFDKITQKCIANSNYEATFSFIGIFSHVNSHISYMI